MRDILTLVGVSISPTQVGVPQVALNQATFSAILSTVFVIIGGLATLFLLIGAVRYTTSGGDSSNVKQAKDTILYAVIGIVLSLTAFTIVQFTIGALQGTMK